MAVLFPKWTNHLPTIVAVGGVVGLLFVIWFVDRYFSPWHTDVGYAPVQPVQYSHKLHAGLLGMDCRYCHHTVERAAHAAVPATETCMNCHAAGRIKADSPKLEPVRQSFATGDPVPWVRVHMLPDYAYFNHSVHLAAGVGCASCHGRIDQMAVVSQRKPLSMGWCLDCHRNPELHLRPPDQVTNMAYMHAAAYSDPEYEGALAEMTEQERESGRAEALRTGLRRKRELALNTDDFGRPIHPPIHCSACHQ